MRRGYRDDPETGALEGERVYRTGSLRLRYLLELPPGPPKLLVAAFSAAHEPHEAPRYYTIRVLRALPCARLFILDDHGPGGPPARPSWYLGAGRSGQLPAAVEELVREIAQELDIAADRVVTCGASKGGWASLYFGARLGVAHVVAGEPQVLLGRHLLQESVAHIAAHVAGGTMPKDGEYLDALLFDAFRDAKASTHVHLYCGRGTPYYELHVLPFCHFLEEIGVAYELEVGEYSNHVPDLGTHFPAFLTRQLTSVIEQVEARGTRVG